MKTPLLLKLGAATFLAVALTAPVHADPYFDISTPQQWSDALASGTISPITDSTLGAGLGIDSSLFVVPTLSVDSDGLLIDFGTTSAAYGGFEYNFSSDPDLNGRTLSLKVKTKNNWKYYFNLYSSPPGASKSWSFVGTGSEVDLNVSAGANSWSGATDTSGNSISSKVSVDTGFDLSQCTSKGLNIWVYDPDGAANNSTKVGEVNVVPEPSAVVLLAFGAVSLLACGRRRSAKP